MANIFQIARQARKAQMSGGISKAEAQEIMQEVGVLAPGEELEDDYVFDYQNWHEPINELEMWDGYTVGEYGQDFLTVAEVVATAVGAGYLAVGVEALKASGASEEVAEEVLQDDSSSNDVVRKWSYLLPFAVLLLFVL